MATVIQIKTAIENWVANHINKFINVERRYDPARRAMIRGELERVAGTTGLSKDVYEIAAKSLEA